MHCPRGKVIGGSSSINGMVYVRGHAHDYDHWAESATRLSYADVLPLQTHGNLVKQVTAAIQTGGPHGPCTSAGPPRQPL